MCSAEKTTNPLTEDDRQAILDELARDDSPFEIVPVTAEVANRVVDVPRAKNADPADRIIVATAEVLGVALVGSDRHIPDMTTNTVIW